LAGRNKPGYDFLESLLLHFPRVNLEWLLTGKGRMYSDISPEEAQDPAQLELFSMPVQTEPRKLEKIIVYYDDNTFQEFRASE
jgi:hypothetical protein